ncbi:MAG: DEAD/DEAH box helicase family protein [Kofleriaceae bacterium]|nr:DEAD/DEAH box helicase family protein [Kofleriaceae bacterium]
MTDEVRAPAGPRNAVANPIINSPFLEPARHYDFSGAAAKIADRRRGAGYHGQLRTDRTDGAIIQHELFPLPVVNELRYRVKQWRERRHPGVTATTRDLLDHWNRADRRRPFFFCQREAVETIIWLTEASAADRQGIDIPKDEPQDLESLSKNYPALRRYCCKMATGSGKTIVMGMLAAWSILNKIANRQDPRFSDTILIVGPNLTVKERLAVLSPQRGGNYYEQFDLVPRSYLDLLARGRVFITNWHVFGVHDDSKTNKRSVIQRGRESDAAFVRRVLGRELGEAKGLLVFNDEAHHAWRPNPTGPGDESQQLTSDERKEIEEDELEATIWVGGLDRINKVRGIRSVIDLSATPFYLKGSGRPEGTPMPWIVSDFGLVDAIECGITKIPRIPVTDDSGRPDPKYFHLWRDIMNRLPASERETVKRRAKPESIWREAQGAFHMLASKWEKTSEYFEQSKFPIPPVMIVVGANTSLASEIATSIKRGDGLKALAGDATFQIDSKVLADAESAIEGETKDKETHRLRLKTATVGKSNWPDGNPPEGFEDLAEPPGKDVRCVVSVGMLTEGWDAPNVTQILGLRAFSSQLLCEQVVGRGLRRMSYEIDPETGLLEPEYCDVFGIPFEVVPVQADNPKKPERLPVPSTLVQSLEERKHLEITWPRVEGFIQEVKERLRCDVAKVPSLAVKATIEPTEVVTKSQTGWVVGKTGFHMTHGQQEVLTRDRFYEEHRLQRTQFEIARDITEVLAGGQVEGVDKRARPIETARLLFPQVLAVVEEYVSKRVKLSGDVPVEEIALATYRQPIIERLLAAIEPDTEKGEAAILPRIDRVRTFGSSGVVQFRTTKTARGTEKSHVSHVVLDSSWENMAAYHFERSPHVLAYVKNDHLDFDLFYEWRGEVHRYIPDYIVRLAAGEHGTVNLILEVKGLEDEQDRAKIATAKKWCKAVNNDGRFGTWAYYQTRNPSELKTLLPKFHQRACAGEPIA